MTYPILRPGRRTKKSNDGRTPDHRAQDSPNTASSPTCRELTTRIPVDTKTLLVALMDTDLIGRWDRICLHSRSREAIIQADYEDPPLPSHQWDNVTLTRACASAFETAWRLSVQYQRTPLQLGILVLGLIVDKSSAASQALNITDEDQQKLMANLIQEDLIGANLSGLRLSPASQASGGPRSE